MIFALGFKIIVDMFLEEGDAFVSFFQLELSLNVGVFFRYC